MHYTDPVLINKFFHFWRRVFTCSCTKTSASSIPQQLGFHQSFPWAHQGDPGTWAKLFLKLTVPSQSESQVSFSMGKKPRFSPKQQIYSLENVFHLLWPDVHIPTGYSYSPWFPLFTYITTLSTDIYIYILWLFKSLCVVLLFSIATPHKNNFQAGKWKDTGETSSLLMCHLWTSVLGIFTIINLNRIFQRDPLLLNPLLG